jgi:dolichol-phosphate mannosyltransferase
LPDAWPSDSAVTGKRPFFSVILPIYNEEKGIDELHKRLTAVFRQMGKPYELVFVDDGSRDNSFLALRALHLKDEHVRVLRFSRNFGHHIAVTAGMDAVRGEVVVMMDSDLQDQPEEIPNMYAKLEEGYDVVYGVRMNKQHGPLKRIKSSLFLAVMKRVVQGFEPNSGIFRMARSNVIDAVKQCRETNRLIVGLMSWAGFRQVGIPVQHGKRFAGETKYTLAKEIRLAVTSLLAFSDFPLQVVVYLGLLVSASSFLFAMLVMIRKLVLGYGEIGWPSLMTAVLFLGGIQLLSLGVIGQYVGQIFTEAQGRPIYLLAAKLDHSPEASDAQQNSSAPCGAEARAEK